MKQGFLCQLTQVMSGTWSVSDNRTMNIYIYAEHYIFLWFSLGILVSSTNKIDHHDTTEILLKSGIKHHNPNVFKSAYLGATDYHTKMLYEMKNWPFKRRGLL